MQTLTEQLRRSEEEAKRLWAMAGDMTRPAYERYCIAWGAMDWETNSTLIREEMQTICNCGKALKQRFSEHCRACAYQHKAAAKRVA